VFLVNVFSSSPPGMPRKRKERQRQECPSECVGCGDAATGYNYEAPSCNACKTFFRRTVLKGQEYSTCLKDGACSKNKSLNPCRACRLERCIEAGMNPFLIITLEDPDSNPVVQRALRRGICEDPSPSTSTASSSSLQISPSIKMTMSPNVIECSFDRIISELLHLEDALQALRINPKVDPRPHEYRLNTLLPNRSMLSLTSEHLNDPPCDPTIKPVDKGPPMPFRHPNAKKNWPFADLVFSIEYMKTFTFFSDLKIEDQKALCRHVSIMCSHLTLAFTSFEKKSCISLTPDGNMPHNGFVPEDRVHERRLHHGIIHLLWELEMDTTEYVLIKAIIVCNPAIEGLSLSHKSELEKEQIKYSKALLSYVITKRGHKEGPIAYTGMMSLIRFLTDIMKNHKNWHVLRQAMLYVPGQPVNPSLYDDIYDF
ncbi:hypothetical protein PMAYCL1PPCAC_28717, partial [Pristionchus mayeri]